MTIDQMRKFYESLRLRHNAEERNRGTAPFVFFKKIEVHLVERIFQRVLPEDQDLVIGLLLKYVRSKREFLSTRSSDVKVENSSYRLVLDVQQVIDNPIKTLPRYTVVAPRTVYRHYRGKLSLTSEELEPPQERR